MNRKADFDKERRRQMKSKRLRDAIAMQKIEGNPLTEEEIDRLRDFNRRDLTPEQAHTEIDQFLLERYGVRRVRP